MGSLGESTQDKILEAIKEIQYTHGDQYNGIAVLGTCVQCLLEQSNNYTNAKYMFHGTAYCQECLLEYHKRLEASYGATRSRTDH